MGRTRQEFVKLKPPYKTTEMSQEEIQEFSKCIYDPVYFMRNYISIRHPDPKIGKVKFNLWDFQIDLVNVYHDYRSVIAMLPRQVGKSTTAAAYILWFATFTPDVTVLVASNKFKGADEILSRIKYAYEELPDFLRPGVVNYNIRTIEFDNGSRIMATTTTPDSGRGLSISLLYLDEFAFVKKNIAEEFWAAIAPTLATGGKCIITSTPLSDEDKFAEIWYGANKTIDEKGNEIPYGVGTNGFKAFSATYKQVPGRDEKWAAQEIARMGEEKFRREYLCEFTGEESTLINGVTLQRLSGKEPIRKFGEIRYYADITPDKMYLVSLDPSPGVGKDFSCIQVWSLPDLNQVAEWMSNKTSIPGAVKIMQSIINNIYDECKKKGYKGDPEIFCSYENNTWGEAVIIAIQNIGEENFQCQFMHEPKRAGLVKRKGLNTNVRTKSYACSKLKSLVEGNKLQINSKALVRQLKFFVSTGESFAAKTGEHDDNVMAALIAVRMMHLITRWDDTTSELMKDTFDDPIETEVEPLPFSVLIS